MNCEFNYCIYNSDFVCIADEISINSLGMCDSCETVTVPAENLKKYKNKRLKEIAKIWNSYDK